MCTDISCTRNWVYQKLGPRTSVHLNLWRARTNTHSEELEQPSGESGTKLKKKAAANHPKKRPQKQPNLTPKTSQNDPQIEQKWIPGAPRGPGSPQGRPQGGPGAPKGPPRAPPERPGSGPERPQSAPGSQKGPKGAPKGAPGPPKLSPKRLRAPCRTKLRRKALPKPFLDELSIKFATEIALQIGSPICTKVASQVAPPNLGNQRFVS